MPASRRKGQALCGFSLEAVEESHIRWGVSSALSATDATMSSFGATESDVGGKISRALYRIAERRGGHTRLDWANSADSRLMPTA
eukprot:4112547-Heterocapsa_arctica.AAC.1